MSKCSICKKENELIYICTICKKEYCEHHIYSHFCNISDYKNDINENSNYKSIKELYSFINYKSISVYSYIIYISIIVYLLSFIFNNIISSLCFYSNILFIILEPWRIITYMFIHGSFIHLLFNMIALNLFGSIIELKIGRKLFLISFILCGIISALVHFMFLNTPLIGSSGSIFGLLSICSFINPNMTIFINFIPIKLKYSIIFIFFIDLIFGLFISDGIAHFAHIGGLISGLIIGYIFLKCGVYNEYK